MKENWKLWLTGAIVLIALGVCIQRVRTSFQEKPPDWMHFQQIDSPHLTSAVFSRFDEFRKDVESEATAAGFPVDSVRLVELMPDGKEFRIWTFEMFNNPGLTPLDNMEVQHWLVEGRSVGYYMLDGTPLHFSLKHNPSKPTVAYGDVQLKHPLAPGASLVLVCLEHEPNNLKPDDAGEITYRFGRLRKADAAVQGMGFLLPDNYSIRRYAPTIGASEFTSGLPMITWVNTRLEAVALPPSVTFKHL